MLLHLFVELSLLHAEFAVERLFELGRQIGQDVFLAPAKHIGTQAPRQYLPLGAGRAVAREFGKGYRACGEAGV